MLNEPLAIEGFYATRLFARRLIRLAVFVALAAFGVVLALGAAAVAAFDLLLVSWGLS